MKKVAIITLLIAALALAALAIIYRFNDPVLQPRDGAGGDTAGTGGGACGIENCHGLDIVCGPNPAEVCDLMYQLGDKCRQFAACGIVGGVCRLIDDPRFSACKACAEQCEQNFPDAPDQAFMCESRCGE